MIRIPSLLITCLVLAPLVGGPLSAADDEPAADAKSVWITSIAPLGESSDFVAATADSLLLREAAVVSFAASNPDELTPLYQHPAAVWCVAATRDGNRVASVDYRGNLVLYDAPSKQPTTHEKAFERWCQTMLIGPEDKLIVAGNEAGKVMIWDIEEAKVTQSVELDGHAITGLAISPDHTQLAASDGAGHVHLLSWPKLETVAEIQVSDETAWCVAYANDGQHLFVGSGDRHLYRVAPRADAKAESVAKGTDWITHIAVSPAGQVAAAEVGGKLHFPSLGGTDSMDANSGLWALCWNGDQQLFAGTRKDGVAIAGKTWKWTEPTPPAPDQPAREPAEGEPAKGAPAADSQGADKATDQPAVEPETEAEEKDAVQTDAASGDEKK